MYWNARPNNNRRTGKHSHINILANQAKLVKFGGPTGNWSQVPAFSVARDPASRVLLRENDAGRFLSSALALLAWTYGELNPALPDGHRDVLLEIIVVSIRILDLWGIGPQPHPCHGCVIPFYYRPIFITCSLTIKSSIFLFLHFFNLFSIRLASRKEGNNFLKTNFIGLCDFKEIVLPKLCSFNLLSTS